MDNIKRLLDLQEVRNIDIEKRQFEFVISDETPDRHGTVLPIDMWNLSDYKKNPIVKYMHSDGDTFTQTPAPDFILGTSEVRIENSQLIAKVTFEDPNGPVEFGGKPNELLASILYKLKVGTLRMTSVGFLPPSKGWRKGDSSRGENEQVYYPNSTLDLTEFSIVHVGSNPNALKRALEDSWRPELPAEDNIGAIERVSPSIMKKRLALKRKKFQA